MNSKTSSMHAKESNNPMDKPSYPQSREAKLAFALFEKAGALALKNQHDLAVERKADASLVTSTDLAISKMAHEILADDITKGDVLIDEESIKQVGAPTDEHLQKRLWVLDPIDGTHPYAVGRPNFAISLGVIDKGQPTYGGAFFPAFDFILWHDHGSDTLLIHKPFTEDTKTIILTPPTDSGDIKRPTFLEIASGVEKDFAINHSVLSFSKMQSQVNHLAWLIRDMSRGAIIRSSLWDLAGLWPALNNLGYSLYGLHNQKEISHLTADLVSGLNWELDDFYVVCQSADYPRFMELIKKK